MPTSGGCAAFEDLPEPVWELSGDELVVTTANRAARAIAPEGAAIDDAFDPDLLEALRQVLRTGEPARNLGWVRRNPSGRSRRYLLDADRIRSADGTARGVLARARPAGQALRAVDGGASEITDRPAPAGLPAHMPDQVPIVRGAGLAAHHVAAPAGVGSGEWFDVVALPGHRVALAVGTVGPQPSDAAEAAAASTLRAVFADCLLAGATLVEVLDRLDSAASRSSALRGATVAAAVLDTATGEVEQARRGHLPMLLCSPGSAGSPASPLDDTAGGPLGVGAHRGAVRVDVLAPGGLLLAHSGGPAPGRAPATRWLQTLRVYADELWPPAAGADPYRHPDDPTGSPAAMDVFATRLIDRVGGPDALPGLTVLTATRPARAAADLRIEVTAVPTELAPLRATLTAWLENLDVTAATATAIPLVVSELASNVVEHAYRGGEPGRVLVEAALSGPAGLRVSVRDDGRWAPPTRRTGYGLAVAGELSETLTVHPAGSPAAPDGSRVEVSFPLGRPPVVHPFAARAALRPAISAAFDLHEPAGQPAVVAVRGPLDLPVVDDLRSTLLHASGGGLRAVLLDLTEATAVASAGVRLLYELSRFAGQRLGVRAPEGSVAHEVLTVAGLAHLVGEPRIRE
jgi:anti-sigma regulatory factor (Ser/Thr protein kinase)